MVNVLDKPNASIEIVKPNKPIRSTGFLPMWSDTRLHWRTVIASVKKNNDSYEWFNMHAPMGGTKTPLTISPA